MILGGSRDNVSNHFGPVLKPEVQTSRDPGQAGEQSIQFFIPKTPADEGNGDLSTTEGSFLPAQDRLDELCDFCH